MSRAADRWRAMHPRAPSAWRGRRAARDHDPYRCLKDVLARLPTQPNSRIEELLPQRWAPAIAGS